MSVRGGIVDPFATRTRVYIRATLRRFDRKVEVRLQKEPLIPCERRLQNMEFLEFQEVTSGTRFEYREYDRPYAHFSVTLCCFD